MLSSKNKKAGATRFNRPANIKKARKNKKNGLSPTFSRSRLLALQYNYSRF